MKELKSINFGSTKWMTNKTTRNDKGRIFDINRKRTKKLKIRENRVAL
jgi:hypothetical protein